MNKRKQKNPIAFMSIKEKGGKKGRENIQADLRIIKREILKNAEEPGVNMPNKKLHPTI